jgi:H+-transporting ATPase
MSRVLGISTVLGTTGVIAAFGLFYLGERVFHLDRAHVQTLMYLKLSVAGHLTIFQTRTRGPWWSTRPAWILLAAVGGTQAVATLIAIFGVGLMPALGWKYAAIVWVYALAWFLVTDPIKLLAYRVLDHFKTETKMKPKVVAKGDARADASKADPKAGAPTAKAISQSKPDATAAPKLDASTPGSKAGGSSSDPSGAAQPEAEDARKPQSKAAPKAATVTDSTSMLDQTLGEILLAGMARDPEDAVGRPLLGVKPT